VTTRIDSCPTTFTVDNNGDAGDATPADGICATTGNVCTLRAAIEEANALPGCGTIDINFNIGSATIALTGGDLAVDHNVNINGPALNSVMVSGNNATRVLSVNSGKLVSISNLTVRSAAAAGFSITALSS